MKDQATESVSKQGVDVVYRLDRIAFEIASKMHEQGLLHVSGSVDGDDGLSMNGPSALVMVQGKPAKQAHSAHQWRRYCERHALDGRLAPR